MKSIKGTRTEKNLLAAFAGESQARTRYSFYASQARKEGYDQIAFVFHETAEQEREHAKRLFMFLEGGEVEITGSYPAGVISNTRANLIEAAQGERYESSDMYPNFAKVAEEEGFAQIAAAMRAIAVAEIGHEHRFLDFAANVENGKVFKRDHPVLWRCRNCGWTHESADAPHVCPACLHPQAFFEIFGKNW